MANSSSNGNTGSRQDFIPKEHKIHFHSLKNNNHIAEKQTFDGSLILQDK